MLDLLAHLIDLSFDIHTGKRYGFGFVIWRIAAGLCLLLGIAFAVLEWYLLSIIGFVGAVACFVLEMRQLRADIRDKRAQQKKEDVSKETENSQELQQRGN